MTELKTFELPPTYKPPYWLPISQEEWAERFGEKGTLPGGIVPFRDGWHLSFFSARVEYLRMTDIGWTREGGVFVVAPCPVAPKACAFKVTHLGTGRPLAMCDARETACVLVETVEAIDGWADVTVNGAPAGLLDTYFAMLRDAGFREELVDFAGVEALVWARPAS